MKNGELGQLGSIWGIPSLDVVPVSRKRAFTKKAPHTMSPAWYSQLLDIGVSSSCSLEGGLMVYLEFASDDGRIVTYDYMPESKDAPRGTVAVDRVTRERILIRKSEEDEPSWYRGHAWRRIEQMLREGILEQETYNAWY